nr:D-alanyl-D-alanine carboxypeptidase family protein [Frigidibacter oleivorans]
MTVVPALAAPYAALVMDARTGEVLYQENAETRLHPASLTKMMTLYIAFEAIEHGEISLDSKVTVSKNAAAEPPSKLGLKPGQQIALRYLIRAAAIKSANDAATAIGEAVGGSEAAFAERMNRTARQLGMKNTSFRNANGLTQEGHLSTAHDMTILGRRLFYDYPQYYNIFSRRSADAGIAQVASTNRRFLDAYEGADGIKTGYTNAAGFNLTASAHRGNKRIIATVLGGKSTAWRNQKMVELLDLGFARAPNGARTIKPEAVAYLGPGRDSLPESPGGAGKIIRLQVAVLTSPRPRMRPGAAAAPVAAPPPEMLVAMQDNIDAVLAQVHDAPAAVAEAVPEAVPEVVAEIAPEVELAAAATAPAIPALRPMARPAALAVAALQPAAEAVAETVAQSVGEAAEAPVEVAAVLPGAVTAAPAPIPTATQAAVPVTPVETQVAEFQSTAPQPETLELAAALAPAPVARPGTIILMSAQTDAPAPEPELEVVSRVSTSGGRHHGISIGLFNTRYNAERALLQTALTESSVLEGSLRKVVTRATGFDANFVGMTEEMAEAACRRLQARSQDCEVVGP